MYKETGLPDNNLNDNLNGGQSMPCLPKEPDGLIPESALRAGKHNSAIRQRAGSRHLGVGNHNRDGRRQVAHDHFLQAPVCVQQAEAFETKE
jgi:hypothetical protein